jgi:WD40 repeat protein
VRLVDLRTARALRALAASGTVRSVQFFGNNERVMVATADPITATFWDVPSGQQLGVLAGFDASASLLEIAISPDGTRAAWMARRTLQFGDVARGVSGPQQQLNAFVDGYAFAPDSSAFGIAIGPSSGVPEGRVLIWDPATSTTRLSVNGATAFTGVAFSPDSAVLATGGHGLSLWSTNDGRRLGSVGKADAGLVRLISFSPDGRTLATVGLDGIVRLWRVG